MLKVCQLLLTLMYDNYGSMKWNQVKNKFLIDNKQPFYEFSEQQYGNCREKGVQHLLTSEIIKKQLPTFISTIFIV